MVIFLINIFHQSLFLGRFLKTKKLVVIPIYQSGDQTSLCNDCAISVTIITCKLVQVIIYSSVMKHIKYSHLLLFFEIVVGSDHHSHAKLYFYN